MLFKITKGAPNVVLALIQDNMVKKAAESMVRGWDVGLYTAHRAWVREAGDRSGADSGQHDQEGGTEHGEGPGS